MKDYLKNMIKDLGNYKLVMDLKEILYRMNINIDKNSEDIEEIKKSGSGGGTPKIGHGLAADEESKIFVRETGEVFTDGKDVKYTIPGLMSTGGLEISVVDPVSGETVKQKLLELGGIGDSNLVLALAGVTEMQDGSFLGTLVGPAGKSSLMMNITGEEISQIVVGIGEAAVSSTGKVQVASHKDIVRISSLESVVFIEAKEEVNVRVTEGDIKFYTVRGKVRLTGAKGTEILSGEKLSLRGEDVEIVSNTALGNKVKINGKYPILNDTGELPPLESTSPNGSRFAITVDDNGNLITTKIE